MAKLYRYAAFISYSSKDAAFARRLHRALERYGIPSSLGSFDLIGGGKKNRIYPVFRDREELSAGHLGEQIEANLRASAALIVVCSPNSAASHSVQKEIEFFTGLGRHPMVFAIVADTAPLVDDQGRDATQACFPSAFRGDALAGDNLEPLAADARKGKDGFRNALLKIVAGMIGVSPGQIIDRDKKRRAQQAVMVSFAALALVVTLGAAGSAVIRSTAEANERRSALFANASRSLTADSDMPLAILLALQGDPAARRNWIDHLYNPTGHPLAGSALAAAVFQNRVDRVFTNGSVVRSVAYSRDGTRVVTASDDGNVRVWDVSSGALLTTLNVGSPTRAVAFSPDGTQVLTGSDDYNARIWSAAGGSALVTLPASNGVWAADFSPDGGRIIVGAVDGQVRVWPLSGGTPLATFDAGAAVHAVAFSPNGEVIFVGTTAGRMTTWPASGGVPSGISELDADIRSIEFSQDRTRILVAAGDKVRVVNMGGATPQELNFTIAGGQVWNAAFSADGRAFVAASNDNSVEVWPSDGGSMLTSFAVTQPWSVAFAPDGAHVLSGSEDGDARIWNYSTDATFTAFDERERIQAVAYSPDGAHVATGASDHLVRLSNSSGNGPIRFFDAGDDVQSVAFSPDSSRVVTGASNGEVRVFSVGAGARLASINTTPSVRSAVFSPDGTQVLTSSDDGKVRLWRASGGEALVTFDGGSLPIRSAVFSPDGGRVLAGGDDHRAFIWNVSGGAPIATFVTGSANISAVDFSPDGARVIAGDWNGEVGIWPASGGEPLAAFNVGSVAVWSVAFSPNGRMVLTGGNDGRVRVWPSTGGASLATFNTAGGPVFSIAFSPDSMRVLAASTRGSARLWALPHIFSADPTEQVSMGCAALRRIGVIGHSAGDARRFPILSNEPRDPCSGVRRD